ncbi:Imm45 family immunity protein [Rhizobium sp. G21]|uniref:Imm45 family immunity protein n=1 Tax=Rhizobium sp. G21 TaxID=2758439 RepID=UPI0016023C84|nr:Imm45 family immunity protein [Rhizobium sp. G21]MBB1248251.1 hypothetical protein [Rhizobium sp. G21]
MKLSEYAASENGNTFYHGERLLFPGDGIIHEDWLEVMLCKFSEYGGGYGFVILSGRKAGRILTTLPKEAETPRHEAVSSAWLIENFNEWVYEDTDIQDVYVLEQPDAAQSPSTENDS